MTYIHYTEVPNPPNAIFAQEWAIYVSEMPRWLAEGQKGRFVLIKGKEVIGIWDTLREALDTGRAQFGKVSLMVHQILTWVPVLRQGFSKLCPTSPASGESQ